MAAQTVFRRYELKYLLTPEQKGLILAAMEPYMAPDKYGPSTIRNLYYDTEDYLLIRRSIEKPVYKEKLRLRSYCQAGSDSQVFVELKKKYRQVVYKRRVGLPSREAIRWLAGEEAPPACQIGQEIEYARQFYGSVSPKVFLSYDRQAYYARDDSGFRITFDENILCRQTDLTLDSQVYGTALLPAGRVLMEVKCGGGIPMWLAAELSRQKLYKTSFSKYGTAYRTLIFPQKYQMLEVTENV